VKLANPTGMVLVKGIGGLGNRMLSVITACLFASAANRRLLVDWRDPIFTGRAGSAADLFCELFDCPVADPLPEQIEAQSVAPALWQGRLDETLGVVGRDHDPLFYKRFGSFRDLAISLRRVDYPEDILVFWSWREVMRPLRCHLIRTNHRYHKMSTWTILREAAQRFLQPCERVRLIVDQFVGEHFRGRMLGLHIRATDLCAPVDKLLRLASRVARTDGCAGVFCSTDNADVEDRVRQTLPNVVMTPKDLPKAGIPPHYDTGCQDRIERATQALVDMLLLSRCQNLAYASRSSFGYVAGLYASDGQVSMDVDRFNPQVQAKKYLQSWIY